MNVITLTTDFGTANWFAGTMKGVMLRINPDARLVDLTHDIPPGDIWGAAFTLACAAPHFPDQTIHVAVVDPGVGGTRRAIAIRTERAVFIGPDNGILSLATAKEETRAIRVIENLDFLDSEPSRTFHGRDIFAPVAARLGRGERFEDLGPLTPDLVTLHWPVAIVEDHTTSGEVIFIDHFGNGITNLSPKTFPAGKDLVAMTPGGVVIPFGSHYAAVPPGSPVAVMGSTGLLEIAVNGGSAANHLRLTRGTRIVVRQSS